MAGDPVERYHGWKNTTGHGAQKMICSQWKGGPPHTMQPDYGVISWMGQYGHILDFGAGIGRNTFALASRSKSVVAYDFPNMIKALRADWRFGSFNNIITARGWELAKRYTFDAVFASLCFQHIHPDDLKIYLRNLVSMTNHLYVHTRACNDFDDQTIMLPIYEEHWEISRILPGPECKTIKDIYACPLLAHYTVEFVPR